MLWMKSFHIIAMVAWFAGLFYLPRLFVYHASIPPSDKLGDERFCTMERKLFWGIMTPSAILTIILGVGLSHMMGYAKVMPLWLNLKYMLVGLLVIYHIYCGLLIKKFKMGKNPHSALFYRFFNEITVFILVGIVLLVVIKPFY